MSNVGYPANFVVLNRVSNSFDSVRLRDQQRSKSASFFPFFIFTKKKEGEYEDKIKATIEATDATRSDRATRSRETTWCLIKNEITFRTTQYNNPHILAPYISLIYVESWKISFEILLSPLSPFDLTKSRRNGRKKRNLKYRGKRERERMVRARATTRLHRLVV